MAFDPGYIARYVRFSYEDYDNGLPRGYVMNLSDECHRCDRRLWFRDSVLDVNSTPLDFCKDCIAYMHTAYKVGQRLGSRRPWSDPPLVEKHIRTFLDPSENSKLVRRRRFEAAWVVILSQARSRMRGTSRRLTITDLDWVQQAGQQPTMGRYELWLGMGERYIAYENGEAFIVCTLLEYVVKFL